MKPLPTIKMMMGTKNVEKHLGVAVHNGNYKKYENVFAYRKVAEAAVLPANNVDYRREKVA